ncbi:elongation factor P maturation arginine rhamnosyltransferase EarP [Comamonas badia]|uniref:elongation factor P maturation arginine rhamnosyltransferase EarP n=1 Tax=Comamonas badia TaxID=265291 RepID=UPI00040104CA|nr:elongation factor P maturation arginine rhamnosyltransferase EarP [Comamonas badia]
MLWDVFCRVVDNWGDIGVCWRLACDLAQRGEQVRLWTDDASALAWMAPDGHPAVTVLPWPDDGDRGEPGAVVLETFGCELPRNFVAAIADASSARDQKPLWINLEYLSAEPYVERSHRLPSPVHGGPGAGLTRWYFYPGFTGRTGGLLRESDLATRQARFDRGAWRTRHGIAPDARTIALFCYEPPALPGWLDALAAQTRSRLLVTPGRAAAAVQAWEQKKYGENPIFLNQVACGQLSIQYLPPCSQISFDELLWASDFNCVRGEDSLARALWAGQPLLWHLYPQHDNAHHAKLDAFLDWLDAPPRLRRLHHAWNGVTNDPIQPQMLDAGEWQSWRECVRAARARLLAQDDLVSQLFRFVQEKR